MMTPKIPNACTTFVLADLVYRFELIDVYSKRYARPNAPITYQ
jgi:hypothetical protein